MIQEPYWNGKKNIKLKKMTFEVDVKFARGDRRITHTKEYIITEVCDGINGYKQPVWKIESIEKNNCSEESKNILINNDEV